MTGTIQLQNIKNQKTPLIFKRKRNSQNQQNNFKGLTDHAHKDTGGMLIINPPQTPAFARRESVTIGRENCG